MPAPVKSLVETIKHPIDTLKRKKEDDTASTKKQLAVERKEHDRKERQLETELEKTRREQEFQASHEKDPARQLYGSIPHNGEHINEASPRQRFADIGNRNHVGDTINFRARIHATKPMGIVDSPKFPLLDNTPGAKLAFITFRQDSVTIQGVIRATTEQEGGISELMVRWAEKLAPESAVLVEGKIRNAEQEVRSTQIHDSEIDITRLYLLSEVTESPQWTVAEMSEPADVVHEDNDDSTNPGGPHFGRVGDISLRSRLANRVMDLRSPSNQALFRLKALLCRYFRNYLDDNGFVEVHTSKLQESASEGGASVFKVDYFRRAAYLAQSPQLPKEMCISADFERVYEIGSVYRAEHSNTHRHMAEFIGLDLEMAIEHSYLEARNLIDSMLKSMFHNILNNHRDLLDRVKEHFPHNDIIFPDETVVIKFRDGIKMLKESGWEESEGEELDDTDDLSRRAEIRLGELVKEKFNTDYYILDQFPLQVRPFYTMANPEDPALSNSFDIFLRGEEILSGGQRLHSAKELLARLDAGGIDPATMPEYVTAYKWGMPPHAGGGIGLERLVMLFFGLGDVRNATMMPRDPRSFPDSPSISSVNTVNTANLPNLTQVEGLDDPAVLSDDPMKLNSHPDLTELIAKYGDSTNTAWTDPEYKIWRYEKSGAAVGYVASHSYAVTWGNPLCKPEEYEEVIKAYVDWVDQQSLKPIWLNVNAKTETILAETFSWRAVSATSEQRLRPLDPATYQNKNVQHKVRAAKGAGMTIQLISGTLSIETRREIDQGILEWQSSRKGTQIHTTEVRPWADCTHRTYFIGRDKHGKPCGILVLHKLSPENGYQIKWNLAFPGSPSGTSEYLLLHVITFLQSEGVPTATFGAGAKDHIDIVDNIKSVEAKMLSQLYSKIVRLFPLLNKSRYREKFGAYEDDLFVCYPSLGIKGVSAIMRSVKDSKKAKGEKQTNGVSSEDQTDSQWSTDSTYVALQGTVDKED